MRILQLDFPSYVFVKDRIENSQSVFPNLDRLAGESQ